jgi:hypothetical protein
VDGRRRSAGLLAAAVFAVLALPLMPLDLPDPIAVRWSLDGEPSGSLPRWVAAVAPVAVWAFVLRQRGRSVRGPAFVAGVLVAVQASVVVANHGVSLWQDARRLPPAAPLVPLAVGVLAGWAFGRMTAARPADHNHSPVPSATLKPHESAVWTGRAYNRGALVLVVVPLLGALPVLPRALQDGASLVPLLAPVVLLGLPAVAFTTVRVVVGPEAVVVGLGPWGRPSRRFTTPDIARASVDMVEPMDVGGWGWRTSGRGRTAIVIRRGEALILDLVDGDRFVVTVDDAGHAAALVNAYRAQA